MLNIYRVVRHYLRSSLGKDVTKTRKEISEETLIFTIIFCEYVEVCLEEYILPNIFSNNTVYSRSGSNQKIATDADEDE